MMRPKSATTQKLPTEYVELQEQIQALTGKIGAVSFQIQRGTAIQSQKDDLLTEIKVAREKLSKIVI